MTTTIIITDSLAFSEEETEKLYTCWGIYKSAYGSGISFNEFISLCCMTHDTGQVIENARCIAKRSVS